VDNALFTTLSTTTRLINLYGRKVLLTDTVGFIDRLPITLIEAFHSTLEETIFSDLILLVVDLSEPLTEIERKLSCSLDTIHKIGASGIPIVTAFNKIDLLSKEEVNRKLEAVKELAPNPVPVSALYGINLDVLKHELRRQLKNYVQVSMTVPMNDETMSFVSWLYNNTNVYTIKYEGDHVNVVFEAVPWFADKVCGQVKKMNGVFEKVVVPTE
jgi:GTP-binding protein HflX